MQFMIRFFLGGMIVSLFAALADTLKPKSFAGLFGAAPSVALATLGLTVATQSASYAALEARSMIVGAVCMAAYTWLTMRLMKRRNWGAKAASISLLAAWFLCAFGLWWAALK